VKRRDAASACFWSGAVLVCVILLLAANEKCRSRWRFFLWLWYVGAHIERFQTRRTLAGELFCSCETFSGPKPARTPWKGLEAVVVRCHMSANE
jgi:hypothetical protein